MKRRLAVVLAVNEGRLQPPYAGREQVKAVYHCRANFLSTDGPGRWFLVLLRPSLSHLQLQLAEWIRGETCQRTVSCIFVSL